MKSNRLSCALKIAIAVSLMLALVSCTRQPSPPPSVLAWMSSADRIVVQGGTPLVEGLHGDPLILTISGHEAIDLKQAIASAEPYSGAVGIKLIYGAQFYQGSNYLGQIHAYGDLFYAEGHYYRDNNGTLRSLIDLPIQAFAEAQRSRSN